MPISNGDASNRGAKVWTWRKVITTMAASAVLLFGGAILQLATDGTLGLAGAIAAMLGGIGAIVATIGGAFMRARPN